MTDTPPPVPPVTPTPPTPPSTQTPPARRHGFSPWRIFIGLIIVLLGLQLLASNYGWNWALSFDLWRLWPLIIILIGLSVLSRGRMMSTVTGVILAVGLFAVVVGVFLVQPSTTDRTEVRRDISLTRESAATLSVVTLDMGAASIDVTGGADQAINGTFASSVADLSINNRLDGTTQRVDLTTEQRDGRTWFWMGHMQNTLSLRLNDVQPTELNIDSGAARLDLDLRTVIAQRVSVDAGASSIDLQLGDKAMQATVIIKSGASSLTVSTPKSVDGVRVHLDAGLSGKTIPSELKNRGDGLYETDNYDTAAKKIDLTIDAGVSSITLERN